MTRNSRRLQKAVQAIFNDYREKASCPGQVYQNAACGCDNALQMWRGPKGEKGDQGPQGPKGDNAGSFLVDAEFVVDPEGQEPGAYLKLVLIDVAQQEQVVYVDLSYLTDIYEGGNGISIVDMVVAARLGAGLTFDANGNIASAYQFCDGLDETSNVVKVRLDSSNRILGFASGTCGGLTATVGLAPSATGVNLVLTGAGGAVLSTIPLEGGTGITVQKNAQTGGFTWLADPAGLVSSQTGNQLSVSQTDNKLYVGGNTLEYTFGTGAFTLKDSSGATLSSVTVPSAVRMLEGMELRTDDGIYLHLTYLRDNGLHAYQDVSLDGLLCSNVDTADDTTAAYSKAVPSGNWQTASINEIGGRTVVWNQLLAVPSSSQSKTLNGVSLVDNRDGTYTVSTEAGGATADAGFSFTQTVANLQTGHKYLYRCTPAGGSTTTYCAYLVNNSIISFTRDVGTGCFYSPTGSGVVWEVIFVASGAVITTPIVFKPRLFDLTLMFGAGNEPATVAEFQAMFPSIDPAYNAGELMSAGVTQVVSESKNLLKNTSASDWVGYTSNFSWSDGIITDTIIASAGGPFFNANKVSVVVGEQYTISAKWSAPSPVPRTIVRAFNADGNSLEAGIIGGNYNSYYAGFVITSNTLTFTISSANVRQIQCGFVGGQTTQHPVGSTVTVQEFQLERSSTATEYTPYRATVSLPIPSAVQSLPGYGWSAGTAYNVVSLAQGKNTQRVGVVDMGSLTWVEATDTTGQYFYTDSITDRQTVDMTYPTIVSARYTVALSTNVGDKQIAYANGAYTKRVYVRDTEYTSAASYKAAMSGVMLGYLLDTPVETDISQYLSDDNLINVEAGGTLTFKNQHGDDFRLPVPNSETFIYEHPWVFEDCVKGAMQPAIDALNARIDDVSVELTLDAHCEDVVTPATAEPFNNYRLNGDIVTLLLEPDGTISDLKHVNTIPNSNTARGSFTMELFNAESTDGLEIDLSAIQQNPSTGARSNFYSNVNIDAETTQKCATLADFLAAGEQGLPLTYVEEIPSSGVTPLAENETLYASVVSNGNNSYTFTFTVRTPDVTEQELTLDLVSGENRTDMKPLLEHIGGKVDTVSIPVGDAVQLPFGYAGAGYIFGSRRSDFPTVGLFANSAEDICAQTNLIQPTSVGPGADTFTYYFDTLPTHFAIPSISEVDATGTKVGTTSYASPMLDMETMRCTGEGTVLADIPEAGLVYTEYDTSSRPFVPTGRTIRLRAIVGNAGIVFTLWQQETVDKPVLCLEPSCDSCIDLSPVMDTVDEMIDKKIAEIPQYEGATASADGTDGLVPAATSAEKDMFLKGDGTWEALPTNHVTTDTNQTITGVKTFGAGVYGNVVALSAGAIDVSAGTVFTKTITANTTISFSNVPAAPATACVTLILTNGGAYTVTWPSSVKWSDGTAPDLTASGVDVLTFLTIDGGTTWYGTVNSIGAA